MADTSGPGSGGEHIATAPAPADASGATGASGAGAGAGAGAGTDTADGHGSASSRLVVAVDLDEVLGQFVPTLVAFHNETYGTPPLTADTFHSYEFSQVWGGTQAEVRGGASSGARHAGLVYRVGTTRRLRDVHSGLPTKCHASLHRARVVLLTCRLHCALPSPALLVAATTVRRWSKWSSFSSGRGSRTAYQW